jgi:autotransporter-associated beta strand protein
MSCASFLASLAGASTYSWSSAPGGDDIRTAANWIPSALPTINDDTFFGPSNTTNLTLSSNASAFSMIFNADAPAYTIGAAGGTQSITLGVNGSPPTGGTLTNNSAFTQTFNAPMAFRIANITAANADIVFNGLTFNVGNNSNNNPGRNITINGSHNVTINSQLTGTPSVTGTTPNDGSTNFGQIIKNGTGTLFLTNNANDQQFTGRITVNTGALRANVANAFGANGIINGSTMGTTHVAGGTFTGRVELAGGISFAPETLVLEGRSIGFTDAHVVNVSGNNTWNGPINLDVGGSPGLYTIQSDVGQLTINGNITPVTTSGSRNLILRGSSGGTVNGNIAPGAGQTTLSLTKDGAGQWTLTGSNGYTGATTINQGTLQFGNGGASGNLPAGSVTLAGGNLSFNRTDSINVTNSISGSGAVVVQSGTVAFSSGQVNGPAFTVNDGAAMTVNSTGPAASMTIANLTLGGAGGSQLNFSFGTAGNPTAPAVISGGLTRDGNNVVNLLGSNFTVGTITLIQYSGTEGGAGSFTLGSLPNRILASLFDTGSQLDLNITGIDFPKWTGALNNTWDASINSNPKDWVLNSNGVAPTDYIEGDSVLFDDSSSVNNINISGTVSPNAVTVNNSTKNYIFTGGGGISGAATLTKTGSGTLTLANDGQNNFTGTISIGAGGTLAIGAGTNSGSVGAGTIVNNGNLVLNRPDGVNLANLISGTGNLVVRGQ